MGDWGLGIGPNPQSPIPNPQSPIPNPQCPKLILLQKNMINYLLNLQFYKIIFLIKNLNYIF